MGFFGQLFGSTSKTNVTSTPDRIWLTRQAKLSGMARDMAQRLAAPDGPQAMVLVAHFSEYVEPLTELVTTVQLDRAFVNVALTDELENLTGRLTDLPRSARVDWLVSERHPLALHDQRIEEFAGRFQCQSRITCYLSLDDPLLGLFSGDHVKSLLEGMGMEQSDVIESKMVTRSIQRAQKQIDKIVVSDTPAASSSEWLKLNRAIT